MNREEAIENLKGLLESNYVDSFEDAENEALDIAIKALEQEPCEMTAEEYRQRMIQAFHNADTDELIAICVLPTEKEFEHLEWLLKNHYKKEPCCNAIDRAEAIKIASGYCHPANVAKELAKLPSVNPMPCEDAINRQAVLDLIADYDLSMGQVVNRIYALPPVTPQPKTGYWIFDDECKEHGHCSRCGYGSVDLVDGDSHNYCRNCGAWMIEPQERSDKK